MPPKKAKKSGSKENGGGKKKTKAPAYLTDESLVSPFGFAVDDIIVTPLGLRGTVLGVKPKRTDDPSVGYAMYVRYEGTGKTNAILDPRTTSGYRREAEVAHVWRDVNRIAEEKRRRDAEKAKVLAVVRAREAEEAAKVAALESNQSKPKKTKKEDSSAGKENDAARA